MKPYGLMADLHLHGWSAFASVDEHGTNTRLLVLLNEILRCADEVKKADGNHIIVAGDLFHVRGSLAPSVLNPALDCFRLLRGPAYNMSVTVLAGNHDLEGKEAARLSSAITSLETIGVQVVNSCEQGLKALDRVVLIPWVQKVDELKKRIEEARAADPKPGEVDLVLHAPIDNVIPGLPAHGLDAGWLASLGFKRVFAGHYHQHLEVAPGVWSIGALAHHTWGDIGTKAGFCVVHDDRVEWHKSHAPEFVEITAATDPSEIPLIVDGHYVRAKINSTKQKDVEELRGYLTDCGAKGVVILAQKDATATTRTGATVSAGASLEVSVADFIKRQAYGRSEALTALCGDILAEARAAA